MSEGPDSGTPESGGTADPESVSPGQAGQQPAWPGRLAQMLPGWASRRPRVTAAVALVLVGALVTGIIVATTPSGPPAPRYTSLPRQSCGLVSSGHLTRYLPGATGTPESPDPGLSASSIETATCKWSSTSGDTNRTLVTQAAIFGTKTAVADTRLSYRTTLTRFACPCARASASERPVAGLGDQAEELFVAPRPGANFVDTPAAAEPGTTVLVQSSNALITVTMNTTDAATGAFLTSPPDAAQLTALKSLASDILDSLARPSSTPPPTTGQVTRESHYAGRRDACKLVGAATAARYAPGAFLVPIPGAGSAGRPQTSECSWVGDSATISLILQLSSGPGDAQRRFDADAYSIGSTVTGAQWLPDLGESAVASYTLQPGSGRVSLDVWSGNAELEYTYSVKRSGLRLLDRSAPLAGVIAMARDGLAALARPGASAYSSGPRYVKPEDACALIRPSTRARYGISVADDGGAIINGERQCAWGSGSVSISLFIRIESDPDSAHGDFQFDVQYDHQNRDDSRFTGAKAVSGLGQQAEATYQIRSGSPTVSLYLWSGNAEVTISASDVEFGSPLSQAGKLAADTAIARDVLAHMGRA